MIAPEITAPREGESARQYLLRLHDAGVQVLHITGADASGPDNIGIGRVNVADFPDTLPSE